MRTSPLTLATALALALAAGGCASKQVRDDATRQRLPEPLVSAGMSADEVRSRTEICHTGQSTWEGTTVDALHVCTTGTCRDCSRPAIVYLHEGRVIGTSE